MNRSKKLIIAILLVILIGLLTIIAGALFGVSCLVVTPYGWLNIVIRTILFATYVVIVIKREGIKLSNIKLKR